MPAAVIAEAWRLARRNSKTGQRCAQLLYRPNTNRRAGAADPLAPRFVDMPFCVRLSDAEGVSSLLCSAGDISSLRRQIRQDQSNSRVAGVIFNIVNLILISVLVPRHALLGRLVQG